MIFPSVVLLQYTCVVVLFGFVEDSAADDSLTVAKPHSDFEKGIGIITFCLELDYENCCDPANPETLKFKDDIVSYVRPVMEETLGVRLNVKVLRFLRGGVNVQLEVSKRFRSTLTPRELSTISTTLEQRIVNSNYSIVIGGTVYRKNCVLYVTVKKPTDEVTDVLVDLEDPCFLFKSLDACENGGVCLACEGFPLCICKAHWTGEYCTNYDSSKGPDSLQCYAPTLTTPLHTKTKISNTRARIRAKVSTTKLSTTEVTITKPLMIQPPKAYRERPADEDRSGIWIIVAAGSAVFVLIIIIVICFVLFCCWPCRTEKRIRKPVAYPHWPPHGSPCDDRISTSSSLSYSSQDTDCVNPLLYELMNHKLEDNFCYPMISSLYQTSQAKRYPYRKVKEPTSYQDGDCWYLGGESRWRHILDEFQNHTSMFQSETPNGLFNWHHNGCTASLTSEGSVTISIHDGDETFH